LQDKIHSRNIFLLGLLFLFTFCSAGESFGQKRAKSKKITQSTKVVPNTPFNFLIGNWASYNREATFAAYCNIKSIAAGSGLEIHFEKPDGTMSVGLIYGDAMDDRWKMTWVGPDDESFSGNGVRFYKKGYDALRFEFSGDSYLNGKPIKDRYTFENVNADTIIKMYEVSTDNGTTWDVEYKYTFKRTQ
jgi:hypothetical protein